MSYDPRLPTQLRKEQTWFGTIISRPIDEDSKMNPISPSGESMEIEAAVHIMPSPTLRPAQRIQIYNQQYWWRLLKVMQDTYPLVTRMMGFFDFNRNLSIPFLVKYPPNHWAIANVGQRLQQWIDEEYHCNDRQLVSDAVSLDWAFVECYYAPHLPPLSNHTIPNPDDLSSTMLRTQPHLRLFHFAYDLLKHRTALLSQGQDHWLTNPAPPLDRSKEFFFALYRNVQGDMSWKEIDPLCYRILCQFQMGASIDSIVEWLEGQGDGVYEAATASLQPWFEEWTARSWLTTNM